MAKYQQYAEYKDSGVEWLEEIPSHWELSKLRYMFSFGRGLTITKADLLDTGVPCVSYGEVHSKYGFEVDPKKHYLKCVDEGYLQSSPYALLNKGDLVFADTSEDIEGSGNFTQLITDDLVFAGYHTVIARPFDRKCSRFYAYLMDSKEIRTQIRHMVKGVKVFSITQSILKGVEIWLPSLGERETIANFLDFETAQIDTLIDKQQTLIQLLKEKRQAVISHAVTKGLNPNAPMKDSGVEWLGEVPEHWNVGALKYWADIIDCKHITAEFVEDGYPLASISEVKDWTVNLSTSKFTTKKYYLELIENGRKPIIGDILYSRNATVGEAALVIDNMPEFAMGQDVCLIRSNDKILSEYIMYVLNSGIIKKQLDLAMVGSTFKRINVDNIRNFDISFPSIHEQQEIVNSLKTNIVKYDSLVEHAEQAIQLMQERRTALISAAVTGKIDVRGWVASDNKAS